MKSAPVGQLWQGCYESALLPIIGQQWVNLGRVDGTMPAIKLGQCCCCYSIGQCWLDCYEKCSFANINPMLSGHNHNIS